VWLTGQAEGFALEAAITVNAAQEQNLAVGEAAVFAFSASSLRIIEQGDAEGASGTDAWSADTPALGKVNAIG
jgi:molybdate transport system ATP-binding protein